MFANSSVEETPICLLVKWNQSNNKIWLNDQSEWVSLQSAQTIVVEWSAQCAIQPPHINGNAMNIERIFKKIPLFPGYCIH